MSLKNLTRIEVESGYMGRTIWRLIDADGNFIEGFDAFSRNLIDKQHYSFTTRKRYSEVVSKLIDYFIEVGVVGKPTTEFQIRQAIEKYMHLLRDGPKVEDEYLKKYANEISMKKGLSAKSFSPTIAAINLFLRFAQGLALEAVEKLRACGLQVMAGDHETLIKVVDDFTTLSSFEKQRLKQNSALGAVIRSCGEVQRPRGIKHFGRGHGQEDLECFDFPLTSVASLIKAATCHRDRVLWLAMGAGGLRMHEALNLQLAHIDVENRSIYVVDPENLRFGRQMTQDEKQRFKGRTISKTFLFEPLKSQFFKYLEHYLLHEYIPTIEHNYLFQILRGNDHGSPLKNASDISRVKSFKKAVTRAGIKGPDIDPDYVWTPHSLRHMYGVYMLNYVPVPGGFGLSLSEVRYVMGHRDINTTRHYARHDKVLLKAKLEWADEHVNKPGFDLDDLRRLARERLLAEGWSKGY
jgi:integrase